MRYWLYKNNFIEGGPAGYWGHWRCMFFTGPGPTEWGGSKAFKSAEVHRYLDEEIQPGDVVVAYQTDTQEVVGFATVASIAGPPGDRELVLQPIHLLDEPFLIHEHKKGTCLEHDTAVNGRVGIRELEAQQMKELVRLSGAPVDVLNGDPGPGGWIPGSTCVSAFEVYDFDSGRGVEIEVRWWEDPPTFVVRDVFLDEAGNPAGVTVRAECASVDEAIEASADVLASATATAIGQVGTVLTGGPDEAWIWLADDDVFVVGVGEPDNFEELGCGTTIAEALRNVSDRILAALD